MKEIQRLLLISIALSSLALVLAVICFPLVHFNLRSLTELVHNDMDHFKDSTDSLWNDLLFLENSGSRDKRDKREGDGFVYQYHPGSRHKLKKLSTAHHLHYDMHRWRKTPTRRYYYNVNSTKYRRRNNKWGRKVVIRNKDAPRHALRRVFAAPTVEVKGKPGKDVFSDSEYIGSLVPMSQKEPAEPRVCKIVQNRKCPKGPPGTSGADGVDGDDGLPGTDGLPGEDGTEAVYNDGKCLLCPAGSPGEKGLLGAPGPSGETGPRGKPGILKELPGPRGPPGPKGEIGEPGISGPRGQMGISVKKWICPPGEKGQRGRRGSAGPAGPKGDTGETGIQGVRGRRGSVGPPGPLGPIGEVGVEGPPGRTGFEQHYCECPNRSKGVRGKFTLPQVPPYVGEDDDAYPKNLFTD